MSATRGDPGRFEWERALRSTHGPTGVRLLVLLTLGTYMNADGSNATVSQATLAEATGQADRTVRQHLAAALADGWLERTRRGHRRGDGHAVTSAYRASLPARVRQLTQGSTGTDTPEEGGLNRQEPASQPARDGTSTGAGAPPTKGFTDSDFTVCVADLATSKLSVPASQDTHTQELELKVKVDALVAVHGDDTVRDALAKIPAASVPFAGEVDRLLRAYLPDKHHVPACERCKGTGQTSTGYPCGCPSTRRHYTGVRER